MTVVALTNEYLALNGGATINDHVKAATLTVDVNELDSTAMGDGWKEVLPGVKSGQLAMEFFDDVAAASVDAVLWPIFATVVTFEVRLDAGGVGAGNPKYTGSVLIKQHSIGGSHGELPMKSLTFPTSGTITRAIA